MQGNRRADETVTKIKVVYRCPVDRRLGRTEYRARTSTPLRIVRLAADLRNYRVHRNGQSGSAPPARVRSSADSPLCGGGPLGSVAMSAKRQRNRTLGRSEMLSSYPERRLWWIIFSARSGLVQISRLTARLGVIVKLAPHMDFGHELRTHGNCKRFKPKLNETALHVQRLGGDISVRYRELNDFSARTSLGVLECGPNKLAAETAVPELGGHIHPKQGGLVLCLFASLKRETDHSDESFLVECSKDDIGCLGHFAETCLPPG